MANTVKVIRVIAYEGELEAVQRAISLSLPIGVKDCRDYTITVGEHLNELPKLNQLTDEQVKKALEQK
jgi:hypothetical protein